jgi:hypothetical protein
LRAAHRLKRPQVSGSIVRIRHWPFCNELLTEGEAAMSMRRVGMIVVPLSLAWAMSEFAPQESSAAIVEISVSGRIGVDDRDDGHLPDSIRDGEPWSGVIRYHTDLPDEFSDAKYARYFDGMRPDGLSISVIVHGYTFAGGNGELAAQVLNDIVFDPEQVFNFPPGDSFSIGGPMSQSPRLLDFPTIFFSWYDPNGIALSSDEMPTSFDPFAFVQGGVSANSGLPTFSPIYIVIEDTGLTTPTHTIYYTVVASIEDAEIRVVPEPSGIVPSVTCSIVAGFWLLRPPNGQTYSP